MTDTATAKYCRGCGTLMLNCGAPIWEDYCPNEKCDWDKNVFRRAVLSAHPSQMPQDVISLVVAAREVAYEDFDPEKMKALDKACEAFAGRVPWDNEPEPFPQPMRKDGEEPCGECHIKSGETCDICGATHPHPVETVQADVHSDNIAVNNFAIAMRVKMAISRAKGRSGWDDPEQCTIAYLSCLLVDHVEKGDPVDVGCLAMMIHQRGASIADERERYEDTARRRAALNSEGA